MDQFVDCKDYWLKIACFRTAGQRITVHRTYTSLITLVSFYLEEDCAYADQVHRDAADPAYFRDLDDGVTNGWDWYTVYGGRQDYTTFEHGGRETTIELSATKKPSPSTLPAYWQAHRLALLGYLEQALGGLRGVVRDPHGAPLPATVTLFGYDRAEDRSSVTADSDVGDYHRLLRPGLYLVLVEHPGHVSDVAEVRVRPGAATRLDLTLDEDLGLDAALGGTVRSATSGRPLPGATVALELPEGVAPVSTDDLGRYQLAGLGEGARVLLVSADGFAPRRVAVQARAPYTGFDVALIPFAMDDGDAPVEE